MHEPRALRLLSSALLALLVTAGGATAQVVLDESLFPGPDEMEMLADPPGAPDLRVLVAAPRLAVVGRTGGVLLAPRPGRVLHAEAGEVLRFVSGVREAVWYRGAAAVGSELALAGGPAGGPFSMLGQDSLVLGGAAPKIDHGRVVVDVGFDQPGEYGVEARVRAGIRQRMGGIKGEGLPVSYRVRVFPPGVLGSITGSVGREEDGLPLPGYPVAAVDPATGHVVEGAVTDPGGFFRIRRLPPGSYLVVAPSRRGFEGEIFDDAVDPAAATPIVVDAGAEVGGIDFLLARPPAAP